MKSRLNLVIFFMFISYYTFSQTDSIEIARNNIYLEAAGFGGYGSLNYERLVYLKKHFIFTIKYGLSTYNVYDYENKFNPDIIIPVTLNGFYGQNHKIEFGFGETFSNIIHSDIDDFSKQRMTNFHTILSIGYRYQKNIGGVVFRCTYTPIIEFNRYYRHWAGISIGYSF